MRKKLPLFCLVWMLIFGIVGCAHPDDFRPPLLHYQGRDSGQWLWVGEGQSVEVDDVGMVCYQDTAALTQIAEISEVLENGAKLKKEFSVNLKNLVEPGAPVYEMILNGERWLMVEAEENGQECQYFFGRWALEE